MKHFILSCALSMAAIATSSAQQTGQLPVYLDNTKPVEQRIDDAIARMTLQEKIRIIHAQSKFSSAGVPRLGFPDFWTDDGPHGVRPDVLWDEWEQAGQTNDSCVAFPALTCLAASWNPQMSRIYGEALGEEALYRGKDMILGPGVNIYRTPLNGRNFEYMSEDPYLASIMVVPYIQGLQSKGVSACVKHYCLNNEEEYRHQVNVIVSDRALHEIYLPAFKAAVEKGKTWGIMGAYNLYKNEHNCHNQWTLNKILKGDWKYDGVVVSDWGGAHDTDQAVKMMTVGGGSSSLKVQREISPLDGLKSRLEKDNVEVEFARGYVGDVSGNYNGVTTGQNLEDKRSEAELIAEAVEKAKHADYVVMFGGLNKSDYQDCEGHDRKQLELPYAQDKLIEALAKANKNFIYVNISGNAVAMPWKEKVAGIIQGWYIGSESGKALASILTGDKNPSGKLPFTWVNSLQEVGAHALNTYPGTWRKEGGAKTEGNIIDEEYKEGIYVGYRWTDKKNIKPAFAFGHGLSYTQFAISNLRSDKNLMNLNDSITFTVNVKNSGKRAGAETIQLYIHDVKASVDRPYKELKGFQKVYLQPGESKDVNITINKQALSFYDETAASWKAEAGKFEALVGNASDQLKLKKAFELK